MIVSASYRTDIPAFYGDWFLHRLAAGSCAVANPYGGRPYTVSLTPETVDGFVFWTRNLRLFYPNLAGIGRDYPFIVQYTITGYPRALESGTIAAGYAVADLQRLAGEFGPRRGVWRYDPVVTSDLTPPDWHRENFTRLAESLAGSVDEVVMSFAHVYTKTKRNLGAAAARGNFAWGDPPDGEKRQLASGLAAIARDHGMTAALCSQDSYRVDDVAAARCIDAGRLGDVAGRPITARTRGNRPDCLCHESRDIGAYDSCAQGCAYCYAVRSPDRARQNLAAHDPAQPMLG
ncbi:MAG: DUF1848 domain-containing protein [Proteobacteria bacterium]|nr:DUF1848 domain-containing protein [Pseudomonadota bacterium]